MARYTFTVPPTRHVGSYSGYCKDTYMETYRQNALWSYNRTRVHENVLPLTRMPTGTRYLRIKEKP